MVKGYWGVIKIKVDGTVKWKIEDYVNQLHSIIIHKVNYLLKALILLIYLKQWA